MRTPFKRVDVVIVRELVVRERDVGNVVEGWAELAAADGDAGCATEADGDGVDWARATPQRATAARRG